MDVCVCVETKGNTTLGIEYWLGQISSLSLVGLNHFINYVQLLRQTV